MKTLFTLYMILMLPFYVLAQSGVFQGKVLDTETGKRLNNVNVFILEEKIGTSTNSEGNFFFDDLISGEYSIRFTHIGYKEKIIIIQLLNTEIEKDIFLDPAPVTLGTITVNSIKQEKLLKDIALPMEVTGKNKIERRGAATPSDLLDDEPGVSISRDGIWAASVSIRGLSKQNIVTLVDGNRIETATNVAAGLSLIDLNDVERIEVIKGGASSIYGSGATGGVVNILTRRSSYDDNFYLNGSVSGTFNSVNEGAFSNLAINSGAEKWRLKLNGSLRNATDAETPAGTLKDSRFRDKNFSAELGIEPFDNHELAFDYQNFYAEDIGIPGGSPFPAGASARYPIEEREMYSAEYKIKRLSSNLIDISFKYFHQFIYREVELKPNAAITVSPRADHITDGIQVQSNWLLGNHFLIFGFDGWQREYKGLRERNIAPQNKIIGDLPIPESRFRSAGIFMNDEVDLVKDKFTLSAGARYDFINIKNEEALNPNYIIVDGNKNANPPSNPLASFAASNVNNKSWSANLGMLYSLDRETDISLNLARSFRSPNLEERFQFIDLAGIVYLGNPELNPERGFFIDLGIRRWNKKVSLRANGFLNLFNDLVIDKETVSDSLFVKSNVGRARLYGFDLSIEYNFMNDFVFYGASAYVRGEDTEKNNDLPEIPPFNGKTGIRFSLLELLNLDVSASVFTAQNKTAEGEKSTPGYALYDLYIYTNQLKLPFTELQIFGGVENIGDKLYRNHLSTNRGFINYEPGRNFFIKAKLSW